MRIFVIGCGGMLGIELYRHFNEKGHTVLATDINIEPEFIGWLKYQNVTNFVSLAETVSRFKPNVIMNLAAMTDLEECEMNSKLAIQTNAIGSSNCATLAAMLDVPYVYISTAGIFDGEKEFYTDSDIPNPLGWYGKSKYWGEQFAQIAPKHIILRCGWQQGGCEYDKKFISKIMKQIKNGSKELNVVDDKLGSPTYTVDFTKQIETMINANAYGVWNAVCTGDGSRYDVAVELIKLLNLQNIVNINKVSSEFWKNTYFAPRPTSEKLLVTKLKTSGLYVMRDWRECLQDYVKNNPKYFKVEYFKV